jgi:hypothetical protein
MPGAREHAGHTYEDQMLSDDFDPDFYYQEQTMHTYLGTKLVKAEPMTRLEYNEYRGWTPPHGEDDEEGYLVEYLDGGKANHASHTGYISWSPKDVFEFSYTPVGEQGEYLPHEYRVVIEKAQLDAKIERLRTFIAGSVYESVYAAEQDRLQAQLTKMLDLSDILAERIESFNG